MTRDRDINRREGESRCSPGFIAGYKSAFYRALREGLLKSNLAALKREALSVAARGYRDSGFSIQEAAFNTLRAYAE